MEGLELYFYYSYSLVGDFMIFFHDGHVLLVFAIIQYLLAYSQFSCIFVSVLVDFIDFFFIHGIPVPFCNSLSYLVLLSSSS